MVNSSMDVQGWLREQLSEAEPDLLRELLQRMVESVMGAEVSARCNASYGERTSERENARNGYRERDWDTRLGTIARSTSPSFARAATFRTGSCSHGAGWSERWWP